MKKMERLYSGKTKDVYATEDPSLCILVHRDDATALNGAKKGSFEGKGAVNNAITATLYEYIASHGIPTHFVKKLNNTEMLVRRVFVVPLEVIVRNIVAGSFASRYGLEEGQALHSTVLEYCLKRDELGDPPIARSSIEALQLVSSEQLDLIERYALAINQCLYEFFNSKGLRLVDIKLEFGITPTGDLVLADEISPDTCRLWDITSGQSMDKDRFRRDLGDFAEAYREVLHRVEGEQHGQR